MYGITIGKRLTSDIKNNVAADAMWKCLGQTNAVAKEQRRLLLN